MINPRDDENPPRQCECVHCGREWVYGEMGDNEYTCFRCEREIELETNGGDDE